VPGGALADPYHVVALPFSRGERRAARLEGAARMAIRMQRHPWRTAFLLFGVYALSFAGETAVWAFSGTTLDASVFLGASALEWLLVSDILIWACGMTFPAVLYHLVGRARETFDGFAVPVAIALLHLALVPIVLALWGGGGLERQFSDTSTHRVLPAITAWALGFVCARRWFDRVATLLVLVFVFAVPTLAWGLGLLYPAVPWFAFVGWLLVPLTVHAFVVRRGAQDLWAWAIAPFVVSLSVNAAMPSLHMGPLLVGVPLMLMIHSQLIALARVSRNLTAVPLRHPIVADFGGVGRTV
jgi:hypothetical protein